MDTSEDEPSAPKDDIDLAESNRNRNASGQSADNGVPVRDGISTPGRRYKETSSGACNIAGLSRNSQARSDWEVKQTLSSSARSQRAMPVDNDACTGDTSYEKAMADGSNSSAGLRRNAQARADWESKHASSASTTIYKRTGTPGAFSASAPTGLRHGSGPVTHPSKYSMGVSPRLTEVESDNNTLQKTIVRNMIASEPTGSTAPVTSLAESNKMASVTPEVDEVIEPVGQSDDVSSSELRMESRQSQVRQRSFTTAAEGSPNSEVLIEATLVDSSDDVNAKGAVRNSGRFSILNANVVGAAEQLYCGFSRRQILFVASAFLCLVIALVIILLVVLAGNEDDNGKQSTVNLDTSSMAPTPTPRPQLELVKVRGVLRCGLWETPHLFLEAIGQKNSSENLMDILLCRAIAAAALGDPLKIETIMLSQEENFQALANGSIDVLTSHVETSMQADVFEIERGIDVGISFSSPYIIGYVTFGGLPEYVACADDNFNTRGNCSGLLFCINHDSEYLDFLSSKIPQRHTVIRNGTIDVGLGFLSGACNVVPTETTGVLELALKILGYQGAYAVGNTIFDTDVGTLATADGDPMWSTFVNIILLGLIAAEEAGITADNASEMLAAEVLGPELMRAVKAVGNYGDVFNRGVVPTLERKSWNSLNNGTTGLMFTYPLGRTHFEGPRPADGSTLNLLLEGGGTRSLRCGIQLNRPGFAVISPGNIMPHGMDVDYCIALAASIFAGATDTIQFIEIHNETDGFKKLHAREVDVLAGITWNIRDDYEEPTTGVGFAFTQPYFYAPVAQESSNSSFPDYVSLVTRQDDQQFSSFVYWTVAATIYAEREGATQASSNDMPDVHSFGPQFQKMFRDAIYAVGNYAEIYHRNLEVLLPRGGRNILNSFEVAGPQLYAPAGFF